MRITGEINQTISTRERKRIRDNHFDFLVNSVLDVHDLKLL